VSPRVPLAPRPRSCDTLAHHPWQGISWTS
jgi:hypothetical protein